MTAALLFNIVSTTVVEFITLQNLAFPFPVTRSVCVLHWNHHITVFFILKCVNAKVILESRIEMVVACYHIRVVCQILQDFPLEALQELQSCIGIVWLSSVMQK